MSINCQCGHYTELKLKYNISSLESRLPAFLLIEHNKLNVTNEKVMIDSLEKPFHKGFKEKGEAWVRGYNVSCLVIALVHG